MGYDLGLGFVQDRIVSGALMRPLQQLSLACRRTEHSSVQESGFRAAGREQLDRIAQPASAGRCKGNDGLAGQIMSLKEGVDDPGRDIPPYGEAQIDRVIVCHVVAEHLHFRSAGRITHLNGAAGRLILPVQILLSVSNLGGYFKQIRANRFSKMLSHFGSMTTRGEVRNQFPTHAHAPRHTV